MIKHTALLLLCLVAACSERALTLVTVQVISIQPLGVTSGKIVELNGCVGVRTDRDSKSYVLAFPPGFRLKSKDIIDQTGRVYGSIGEEATISGAPLHPKVVDKFISADHRETCGGDYWQVTINQPGP